MHITHHHDPILEVTKRKHGMDVVHVYCIWYVWQINLFHGLHIRAAHSIKRIQSQAIRSL